MIKAKLNGDLVGDLSKATKALRGKISEPMIRAALYLQNTIVRVVQSTFSGNTGNLARSYEPKVIRVKDGSAKVGVYSSSVYAEIQDKEEDQEIKPRVTKNLAIPLTSDAKKTWPRYRKDLFYFKSKKGNKILATKDKKGEITPQYVLKPSVFIHGKGYLRRSLKQSQKAIDSIMGEHVDTSIESLKGSK